MTVNTSKLKKAIVKEFKRSPAKSIVLLLLCPLALYFVAPLFKGVLPRSTKATAAVVPSDTAPFMVPLPALEPATVETSKTNWRKIAEWMEVDQLSQPFRAIAAARSPFVDPTVPDPELEAEQTENEQISERPPATVQDIFEKGFLKLTMTMLGKKHRLATINGRVFAQGDVIPVAVQNGTDRRDLFKLNLAQVERRSAVITYNEEKFLIELQNRLPADTIIVRPAKSVQPAEK